MIWFIFILVVSLLATLVLFPMGKENEVSLEMFETPKSNQRRELREQKAALLLSLRELDFDFEMGKLSKEDYVQLKEKIQAKTIETLKKMEVLDQRWNEVQKEVDQWLKQKPKSNSQFCSQCGNPIQTKDRFCGKCGGEIGSRAYA